MRKLDFLVIVILSLISCFLMWHTFSYSSNNLLISLKAWGDFAAHIPLIRSFSWGSNFPPELPLFPGSPIRYHYLFYLLVGLLERLGLRLDFAFNLPSALGFSLMLFMVYKLSFLLFGKKIISLLSVVFCLFNGSLSYVDFLTRHKLSELISLKDFPAFAPWNSSRVVAFWNLNIFTNQRHLAPAFAIALFIIYLCLTRRFSWIGFLLGLLLLLNQPAFLVSSIFVFVFFVFNPNSRLRLIISAYFIIPWTFILLTTTQTSPQLIFRPGFLTPEPRTLFNIIKFWFFNIGPHLLLIPLGFILSPKKHLPIIISLLLIFLLPNLFQFSSDMINNHKLFNFFLMLGGVFSAYALTKLPKLVAAPLFIFCILGGLVDIFPVINDNYVTVADVSASPMAQFFSTLPSRSVVLNSTWFYNPASLVGRPIYYGYPYVSFSYGYDQIARESSALAIFRASSKSQACQLLSSANISYVELSVYPEAHINPNLTTWGEFAPIFTDSSGNVVYSVSKSCI